jgi:nicotinate-nucleotide adenylyltransferase
LKKIGIYGGTFDPVHHGHLILARETAEQLLLERVVFMPAAVSPHKLETTSTAGELRLEMLRAAVAGDELLDVSDAELQRPPPSYTIDTVEAFRSSTPDAELFYLIGEDQLPKLHTWHRIEELRRLVQFVVLSRGSERPATDFPTIQRQIGISATEIRNRVATGRSIRYLVPPAVEEIITRHQLYQEQNRSTR